MNLNNPKHNKKIRRKRPAITGFRYDVPVIRQVIKTRSKYDPLVEDKKHGL